MGDVLRGFFLHATSVLVRLPTQRKLPALIGTQISGDAFLADWKTAPQNVRHRSRVWPFRPQGRCWKKDRISLL
jgi:hypothetical protein